MVVRICSGKVFKVVGLFAFAGIAFGAQAKQPESSSFLAPVNELGIGTVSGKIQALFMRRDFDGEDASSGTLAETLNYKSPHFGPFTFGLQYIRADRLFEGGSLEPAHGNGQAWHILNTDFHVLNEAYVNLNFDFLDLPGTDLTVGRQIADYNFAPTYNCRQKPQAIEAAVLSSSDIISGVSFELGHIEKFSSWSTRDGGNAVYKASFNDIEDVIADSEGIASPDTHGMQFVTVSSGIIPQTDVTVYDLYGANLYNTFGAKADIKMLESDELRVTWKNHYIMQSDVGDFANDLDARTLESALEFKTGNLMVQPGVMTVFGGDDLRHPFESSLTWESLLDWYTRPNLDGSDSAYLKSTYTFGDTLLYALYFVTDHDRATDGGAFDQELDIVINHDVTDRLYVTLKLGYGYRDNRAGNPNTSREDYRLFVGYTF